MLPDFKPAGLAVSEPPHVTEKRGTHPTVAVNQKVPSHKSYALEPKATSQGNIVRTQHYSACILFAGLLLAGCGGSGDAQGPNTCSLTNPAGCGGTAQPGVPQPPDPAARASSVTLVFSSTELGSAGLPGSEVSVTALAKSADNTAVADARIEFSADSGLLAVSSTTTDKTGKASAMLGTGGSRLNRPIKVSAKVGSQLATAVVNVVGTRLLLTGPSFVLAGSSADLVATLLDSAGRPIGGETISASAKNGNTVAAAAASDSKGQVLLKLQAAQRGDEQVSVSALGASAARPLVIGANDLVLSPAITLAAGGAEMLKEVVVGSCSPVDGQYAAGQTDSVTLTASRGRLYRDAACTEALSGSLSLAGGNFPRTYIVSENAGVSTIEAAMAGGPSATTRLEFVAPLAASSKVHLQTDLAVLGNGERSTLIAVVRDGTAGNNLVKGALVQFSILSDPSGGVLESPFTAVTGSDGVARAVFVAGPADGGRDGTVIQARLAALPAAASSASLTVSKKALSIQFGSGNSLVDYSPTVLQQDFVVFVSDSAGNAVRDVAISAAAWPTMYGKGQYIWSQQEETTVMPGTWVIATRTVCANEDVQRRGLYDRAFDHNGNGTLEPGIPLSVSASGRTDAFGMTTISLRYPRDRAGWVKVELSVAGTVAGTESVARNSFWLPALASDLIDVKIDPPGRRSPYGTSTLCNSSL